MAMSATASRATATQFQLHDIGLWDDPYPHYARARAAGRVLGGGPGQWVITHYEDVAALLRDPRLSHEFPEEYHRMAIGDGPANSFVRRIILNRDPPAHTLLRRVMSQVLSPRYVARLGEPIAAMASDLLEPAVERGRLEVVEELAFPLPVMVACELIGVPAEDRPFIRHWAGELTKAFGVRLDSGERATADEAVTTLREYVDGMLRDRERGRTPAGAGDDLASLLLAAIGRTPEVSRDDVVDNVVFLFFAGFETTVNLIATGAWALLEHPGEQARLRTDRSLLRTAVEEFLRFDGPIPSTSRLVREDLVVAERKLRTGRVVHLLLGSANRDPLKFHDPDRLDLGRHPNPHLGFSGGPHYCLGAALARLESAAAFACLLDRCATLEPDGPARRRLDPSFRTLERVPAAVSAA
jgi:cytochrome P450